LKADERDALMAAWTKAGEALFGPGGAADKGELPFGFDRATPERLSAGIHRLALTFTAGGIALAMPLDEPPAPHAVAAALRLCGEAGLRGFSARGKSPAATREILLDAAIAAGCDRLLFLGHDSLIDRNGLWQLMASMDRHGAAAVAAVTVVPVAPPEPAEELSAFVGHGDVIQRLRKDDVTSTGTAFPVHHLDGIVALLLDLVQIRRYQGPRFSSRTEGSAVVTEDEGFAKWLDMHSLDLLVDPKAQVARVGQQIYGYRWQPPKDEG